MFPYLEKYLVNDYLPMLVDRIEYTMSQMEQVGDNYKIDDAGWDDLDSKSSVHLNPNICDRALLLDYKAELLLMKKDYKNALKKRLKAINIMKSAPLDREKAENYLLTAESIITDVMGTDNKLLK